MNLKRNILWVNLTNDTACCNMVLIHNKIFFLLILKACSDFVCIRQMNHIIATR